MGLGSANKVSLKEARESAERARALVQTDKDPIKERIRERNDAVRKLHVLKDTAADAFESRKAELKGDGIAGRWFSLLELHILPKLGSLPVAEIDQKPTAEAKGPNWQSFTLPAARLSRHFRGKLSHCRSHGSHARNFLVLQLRAASE